MSTQHGSERRQVPRVALDGRLECRLELRTRVRLLDISVSGALLAAELALPVGVPARLQSSLGATAFHSDVQVRRNVALSAGIPLKGLGRRLRRWTTRAVAASRSSCARQVSTLLIVDC
jgi:hypothetical protein